MKKILAIALTFVMLIAVCIPSFAAKINVNDNAPPPDEWGKQTVSIGISTTEESASYTVTIPATIIIPWESPYKSFEYSIAKVQLKAGKRLKVSFASQSGEKVLVDGNGYELPYTFTTIDNESVHDDELGYITPSEVALETVHKPFNISIAEKDWKTVPVNNYIGNLTFTVDVVDA